MTLKRSATPGNIAAILAAVGLAAGAAAVAVPALASTARPGTARPGTVSIPDVTAPGGMPRLALIRTQSGMTVEGFPTKPGSKNVPVSYTHLRAHATRHDLVCRLLLEKKTKMKDEKELKHHTYTRSTKKQTTNTIL